jgi:outer membrane receptor protein involved in Fe transport
MIPRDFAHGLRFIFGLRAENTFDGVHNLAFGDNGVVTPNSFSGSYYTLLPSASLRFNAGTDSYVRLIYARGLSRPDPQDIAQPLSWTVTGNGSNRFAVTFGNANLKAETGDDIDVLYDHYFKTFGVISAGYFYKNLQNPIVVQSYQLVNYLPPGAPPTGPRKLLGHAAGERW